MTIDWKFDLACAQRYDMDSDDVDAALANAGLDRDTASIDEAKKAVRQYAIERHYEQPALPKWI